MFHAKLGKDPMMLRAFPLVSHPSLLTTVSPTKIPTLNNCLIPRSPCLILRFSSPLSSFSTLSVKPTSTNSVSYTVRAAPSEKYVYPDPIPQFAESETQKFKAELLKKLSENKGEFGDELDAVVDICAQILGEFLHTEYGGPGTLLVEPFTDMLVALKQKKLPGAPLAARASLLWAQSYVDEDWEIWNSKQLN